MLLPSLSLGGQHLYCARPWAVRRAALPRGASGARRPVGCSAANSSTSQLVDLRAALSEAVADEDYALAASLRDQIASIEREDPESVLKNELKRAVREERFEDAALLKAKLTEFQLANCCGGGQALWASATASEAVTEGVRVTAQSFYVPDASKPEEEQFLFAYHVTIKNEHPTRTVKLVERYLEVTNDKGQIHEMRGEGVVGRQPVLEPGQSFFYQATLPLSTPVGEMKGRYEMYLKDANGKWTSSFLADIGAFGLDSRGQ